MYVCPSLLHIWGKYIIKTPSRYFMYTENTALCRNDMQYGSVLFSYSLQIIFPTAENTCNFKIKR